MSTIVGNVAQILGSPKSYAEIKFVPASDKVVTAVAVVAWEEKFVRTDAVGYFATTLAMGDYYCYIGVRGGFIISVPDDTATYNWIELITSAVVYSPSPLVVTLGWFIVDTLAALRAIPTVASNKHAVLCGELAAFDISPRREYRWTASAAADDAIQYIRPTDYTTHLWRQIA